MKYIVTSQEMKEYDNNTIEQIGIPALVLMERAALALRDRVMEQIKNLNRAFDKVRVLIAAGSGNNGADGLALARLLCEQKIHVTVLECGKSASATDSYKKQKEILAHYQVDHVKTDSLKDDYDVIVDGIFGVGLTRDITEEMADIIDRLNQLSGWKLAIDIPSGICGTTGAVKGTAFCADETVTFGFGKRGLYLYPGANYCGKVFVADIGINERGFLGKDPAMFTYDEDPSALLPARKQDGNKGTFGKVLLLAGWETMAGAGVMAAKALLQTGAGMVKVCCSPENRCVLQAAVPEVMYGDKETLYKDAQWADVFVAGPGLGQSDEAASCLQSLLDLSFNMNKPMVLDADGLNLLAIGKIKAEKGYKLIMTPHLGELSRLTGKDISYIKTHLVEVAKEAALDYDSVMVCKDARTYVHGAGEAGYLNLTGNSGMATAGSGDVLSGVIGALLAQGMDLFEAACTGVYLHGLAGDAASGQYTEYGVTAMRIVSQIEEVMKGS